MACCDWLGAHLSSRQIVHSLVQPTETQKTEPSQKLNWPIRAVFHWSHALSHTHTEVPPSTSPTHKLSPCQPSNPHYVILRLV